MKSAYERECMNQFFREAKCIISKVNLSLEKWNLRYSIEDKTKDKALWMLSVDAFDTINDCLNLLENSNHRITGKLIRDIAETLNLIEYFNSDLKIVKAKIEKWFNDDIIQNSEYRDYIKKRDGEEIFEYKREYYKSISKVTHHTYKSLLYAYSIGSGRNLVYERALNTRILLIPESIAMYCTLLANLIFYATSLMVDCNINTQIEIDNMWIESIENYEIPRRYTLKKEN